MTKSKFAKPPLSAREREKKAQEFINGADELPKQSEKKQTIVTKERIKPLYLRAPTSLWEDIHKVMALTGLSMNAICLEALRPIVKQRLKDLRES